jgi:uncharacterized membrane protein
MSRLLKMGLPLVALVAAGLAFHLWGQGNALAAIVLGIVTGASLAGAAMAVHALLGVAVTCAMGAGVGAYLTLKHHDALSGGAASACNVNETFNCDLINTSQYSEIAGVPIALIGVAFYLALGLTAWLGWRDRHGYDRAPGLVVAGGVAAVGYSAFLAWASTTVGAWCLFCISLYVVNALILAGGLLASKADPAGASVSAALQGKGDRSMSTALVAGLAKLAVGSAAAARPPTTSWPSSSSSPAARSASPAASRSTGIRTRPTPWWSGRTMSAPTAPARRSI